MWPLKQFGDCNNVAGSATVIWHWSSLPWALCSCMNTGICACSKLADICPYFITARVSTGVAVILCDCWSSWNLSRHLSGTKEVQTAFWQSVASTWPIIVQMNCAKAYSVWRIDTMTQHPLMNPVFDFIFQYLLWMIYWNVYLLWFTKSLYWVNCFTILKLSSVLCWLWVVKLHVPDLFNSISYSVKCIRFAQNRTNFVFSICWVFQV